MNFWFRNTLLAAVLLVVQAAQGLAQIPGGSGIVINNTPVTGGTTSNCLYVNGAVVGQQACGGAPSGAAGGDLTGTYPNPTIKPSVSLTTPNINVATATSINGNTITAGTGTLTLGAVTLNAGAGGTLGSNAFTSTSYMPLAGGTFTGAIGFSTTNTLDIGTNATTLAPRTVYAGTSFVGPIGTFTTSLNVAGATIGSNAVAATGQFASYGATTTGPGFYAYLNGDTLARVAIGLNTSDVPRLSFGPGGASVRDAFILRAAPASIQHGDSDVDTAPVAQTLRTQGTLAGGTSNVAGANFTVIVSPGKGTGVGGSYIVQTTPAGSTGTAVNAPVTALTIDSTKLATFAGGVTLTGDLTSSGNNFFVSASTGQTQLYSGGILGWSSTTSANGVVDTFLRRGGAAATVVWGTTDAAAPVAQNQRVQNVLTGTNNANGANWSFMGSLSTGSGVSGDIIFQTGGTGAGATAQNTAVTAITVKGANQEVRLPQIASDGGLTDTTVCQDTTNHGLRSGSGALGICLGTSGRQFKNLLGPQQAGLDEILKIKLWDYYYLAGHGDNGARLQRGPTAQDIEAVIPDLVGHDKNGETINYDWGAMIPIAVRAIQQLKADNDNLRADVEHLKGRR